MQLGLFVVVVFLSSVDLAGSSSSKALKGKRQRPSMYEKEPLCNSSVLYCPSQTACSYRLQEPMEKGMDGNLCAAGVGVCLWTELPLALAGDESL